MKNILFLFVMYFSAACATHYASSTDNLTYNEIYQTIDDCIVEAIDLCGDTIGEGDLEFEPVIEATGFAVKFFFEQKQKGELE